jgi:hypothetical protein
MEFDEIDEQPHTSSTTVAQPVARVPFTPIGNDSEKSIDESLTKDELLLFLQMARSSAPREVVINRLLSKWSDAVKERRSVVEKTSAGDDDDKSTLVKCPICETEYTKSYAARHFRTQKHIKRAVVCDRYCKKICRQRKGYEHLIGTPPPMNSLLPETVHRLKKAAAGTDYSCGKCGGRIANVMPGSFVGHINPAYNGYKEDDDDELTDDDDN